MPYVQRDAAGGIDSMHRHPQRHAREFLDAHDPEVQAFLGLDVATGVVGRGFQQLDAGFVRTLEDLLDVLIAKHLVSATDLPLDAQAKLLKRKSFRRGAPGAHARLYGDTNIVEVIDDSDFDQLR